MIIPEPDRSEELGTTLLEMIAGTGQRGDAGIAGWLDAPGVKTLLGLLIVSSISGTGLIVTLNAAASSGSGAPNLFLLFGFVTMIILYKVSQTRLIVAAAESIELSLSDARLQISRKLLDISLRSFENAAQRSMAAALVQNCRGISAAVLPLMIGLQSTVLLTLTLGYLFVISPASGVVTVAVGGVIVFVFLRHSAGLKQSMAEAATESGLLLDLAHGISAGFRELRLHRNKREAVLADYGLISANLAQAQIESSTHHTDLATVATSVAYLLGAAAVFLLPIFGQADAPSPRVVLTIVLFMIGPLGGTVGAAQQLAVVRFSYREILKLEATLDGLASPQLPGPQQWSSFQELRLAKLRYAHSLGGETTFEVGPIDLSLRAGRVVFITGGNGSGKTTALRLICGLYPPESGQISVNGREVPDSSTEAYRELFGPVFADPHLFNRPYGLDDNQTAALEANLDYLRIRHKLPADLRAGFRADRLSTGERKRLALAFAMAEDRPVLIFDELAADQDVDFRRFFYRDVLSRLRREGRAVLAVTHDDRYFDAADERYHMEEGRLSPQAV